MASIVKHQTKEGVQWRVFIRRSSAAGTVSQSRLLKTKAEAQRWARDREHQLDRQQASPKGLRYTFADVLDEYIEHSGKGGRTKTNTLAQIKKRLGALRLSELSVQALTNFVRERVQEGAGPATIQMDLAFIGGVLRHGGALLGAQEAVTGALAALAAARTTARHMGLVGPSKERARRPTETELELIRGYLVAGRGRIPLWRMIMFAIATAMRLGEICRITWGDVDWEHKTLRIKDRKHPTQKKGNDQTIPLLNVMVLLGEPLDAMKIIAEQKTFLQKTNNPSIHPNARVFPYVPHSVTWAFADIAQRLGIVDLHFHDLRHEGVSRLFEAGYSIEQVAIVSGHRDWKQLKRYTNIKPASLHRTRECDTGKG